MEELLGPGYEVGARAPPDGGKGASVMMFAGRPPNDDATKSRPPFVSGFFLLSGLGLQRTVQIFGCAV